MWGPVQLLCTQLGMFDMVTLRTGRSIAAHCVVCNMSGPHNDRFRSDIYINVTFTDARIAAAGWTWATQLVQSTPLLLTTSATVRRTTAQSIRPGTRQQMCSLSREWVTGRCRKGGTRRWRTSCRTVITLNNTGAL